MTPQQLKNRQYVAASTEEQRNSLPSYMREVLTMFENGKSYEEIAQEKGLSLGTVRSRLHRSRYRMGMIKISKDYNNRHASRKARQL